MKSNKLDFENLLEESVNQFAKGNSEHIEVITYKLRDLPEIDLTSVKELRKALGATQKKFGDVLDVSTRKVEAWEIGRSSLNGSAARLMR
ncbi:helix-turn-helix domain-containing protein [Planococcus versutus]|uniref:HTH cro/C1-type domain-containing protein n=1 Tax=Planococcus versutus TaxID=1302659 RepID=A0A1B1S536_9BACL|nr:transcriptional regulator [Planococcus versutus]ANU28317.1 hypothetical protein I858_015105 [Planococcus versutus]